MTLTVQPQYIYFVVTLIVLLIQLYNTYKLNKIKTEVDSIWQQIAVMAIASASAFDKLEKKIDGKEDKK
jgi:hypothetical protein